MYIQKAIIKGRGEFPVDMLRYDRCAPYTEQGAYELRDTIAKGDGHQWELTVVRYVTTKTAKWSIDRWQSFGVDITPGDTEKLA
jgi:hypothetical protein